MPVTRIFVGGAIFREGAGSIPGWGVRIRGDRIDAVLPEGVLRAEADAETIVTELGGGLVSPGFVDAHFHPTIGGVEAGLCDLSAATTVDEVIAAIRAYAAAHPQLDWIVGGGWAMDLFPGGTPRAGLLDSIEPDRPVSLANRDHHGYWVNSAALRAAGITAETPDPVGGRIERDLDGSPSGTLHEAAADLVNALAPATTRDGLRDGLLRGQALAFSLGITGWQDARVDVDANGVDVLEAYLDADAAGELRAHASLSLWWDRDRGLEQLDELIARRERVHARGGRVRASTVKLMVDGVAENFTAAVSRPYLDAHGCATGNTGHSFIPADRLREIVRLLDENDFQAHFHALGDRAVTEALDAVAHARATNGDRGNRHHLAHLQMVRVQDAPRFAQLDATANLQPLWANAEAQLTELTLPFLHESLRDRQYPFHDLVAAGARLAGGSDWPVSSANPLEGMQVAVTRQYIVDPAEPLTPEQAVTLERIWTAYTAGSAHVHGDADAGTLAAGLRADLVVLDRDPFARPANEISRSRVVETIVAGTTVHSALERI
ncbi:amidohydrolase [Microbacterium ulmi]|uniref:Amidohydrolase n=1 Tax=Microbacterium ulmi TaxID=179095 RepID=A0A7Y2LWV4_9MICO|nr:amidohydrolase [Microbacterium ulmi]NII68227.1 hypothetical protein [Microbacterium ulmi]NNH02295.1 amidohydrolase [Microbacterium ulmi]